MLCYECGPVVACWRVDQSSNRACSAASFIQNLVSLAQVIPDPIQPYLYKKVAYNIMHLFSKCACKDRACTCTQLLETGVLVVSKVLRPEL